MIQTSLHHISEVNLPCRGQLVANRGCEIQHEEEEDAVAAHRRHRAATRAAGRRGDADGAHGARVRLVGRGQAEAERIWN